MSPLLILNKLFSGQTPTNSEWQAASSQLLSHHLAGYLYVNHQPLLPSDMSSLFERIYEQQALQNHLLLEELERIEKKIFTSGLPHLTRLKGTALIGSIYQDPGERHLSDADVYINHKHRPEFEKFLIAEGYQELHQIKWEANAFKSTFYKTSPLGYTFGLDVHDQLLWRQNKKFTPTIIKYASKVFSTPHAYALHPADLYCHLVANWAYQDTFISLNKLLDIYLLKNQLAKEPASAQIQQILELNGLKPAEGFVRTALSYIDTDTTSKIKNYHLLSQEFLANPRAHKFKYVLLKHLCKKNIFQAFLYDWQWLLGLVRQSNKVESAAYCVDSRTQGGKRMNE